MDKVHKPVFLSATYRRQNRSESIHTYVTFTTAHSRNTGRALSENITENNELMFTRNSVLLLFEIILMKYEVQHLPSFVRL
jgi:hypothetical protein